MSYCTSHMIGIRAGGVFSGDVDMEDVKARIQKIVVKLRDTHYPPDLGDQDGDPSHCMSRELAAHKGSYVVIAGIFNYWDFEAASVFAKRLSKEFGTEIMHMAWDEEADKVQCQIWLDGKPLFEQSENAIGQVLRRLT